MIKHHVGQKWSKFSNAAYENEILVVDNPFNEDSKNIIFRGGTAGKFMENGHKHGNLSL